MHKYRAEVDCMAEFDILADLNNRGLRSCERAMLTCIVLGTEEENNLKIHEVLEIADKVKLFDKTVPHFNLTYFIPDRIVSVLEVLNYKKLEE